MERAAFHVVTQVLRLLPSSYSLESEGLGVFHRALCRWRTEDVEVRIKPQVTRVTSVCIPLGRSDTWPPLTAEEAKDAILLYPGREENRTKRTCSTVSVTASKKRSSHLQMAKHIAQRISPIIQDDKARKCKTRTQSQVVWLLETSLWVPYALSYGGQMGCISYTHSCQLLVGG